MTPTPTAPPLDPDTLAAVELGGVVLALVLVLALSALFVFGILRSARSPAPVALVLALSLLSLLALAGAIATQSTELVTLAATGIGALAGAVSATFDRHAE